MPDRSTFLFVEAQVSICPLKHCDLNTCQPVSDYKWSGLIYWVWNYRAHPSSRRSYIQTASSQVVSHDYNHSQLCTLTFSPSEWRNMLKNTLLMNVIISVDSSPIAWGCFCSLEGSYLCGFGRWRLCVNPPDNFQHSLWRWFLYRT